MSQLGSKQSMAPSQSSSNPFAQRPDSLEAVGMQGAWHAPPEQTVPLGQVVPQAPQFCGSLEKSRQAPPQQFAPIEQAQPHAPDGHAHIDETKQVGSAAQSESSQSIAPSQSSSAPFVHRPVSLAATGSQTTAMQHDKHAGG